MTRYTGHVRREQPAATHAVIRQLRNDFDILSEQFARIFKNNTIVAEHNELQNLEFNNSGHVGFASQDALNAHTTDFANPHQVTPADVGAIGSTELFLDFGTHEEP